MRNSYKVGKCYEFEVPTGYVRRCTVVRTSRKYVWLTYHTEKTRRAFRIERKDKRWKERLKEVYQKSSINYWT